MSPPRQAGHGFPAPLGSASVTPGAEQGPQPAVPAQACAAVKAQEGGGLCPGGWEWRCSDGPAVGGTFLEGLRTRWAPQVTAGLRAGQQVPWGPPALRWGSVKKTSKLMSGLWPFHPKDPPRLPSKSVGGEPRGLLPFVTALHRDWAHPVPQSPSLHESFLVQPKNV